MQLQYKLVLFYTVFKMWWVTFSQSPTFFLSCLFRVTGWQVTTCWRWWILFLTSDSWIQRSRIYLLVSSFPRSLFFLLLQHALSSSSPSSPLSLFLSFFLHTLTLHLSLTLPLYFSFQAHLILFHFMLPLWILLSFSLCSCFKSFFLCSAPSFPPLAHFLASTLLLYSLNAGLFFVIKYFHTSVFYLQ